MTYLDFTTYLFRFCTIVLAPKSSFLLSFFPFKEPLGAISTTALKCHMFLLTCSFLKAMSRNGSAMPWKLLELISLPAVLHFLRPKIWIRNAHTTEVG